MARALRIDHPGAWHHVVHRGIGRADIFHHDLDRAAFVELLGDLDDRFGLEVHAYVLMGNHYHLLVRSAEGRLARAMRHLNGCYTQRHNWHHGRDGALLAGRFHSSLIEADSYLTRVARYVHLNPVTAGLAAAPEAYRWSSYSAYLHPAQAPTWLHRERVLECFAGSRGALHRFTVAGEADDGLDVLDRRAPPAVLGSDEFKTKALARADCSPEKATARRRATVRPTLEAIDAAVAAEFEVARCTLYEGRRGHPNLARMVAGHLAVVVGGASHAVVRDRYGYRSTGSATAALGRLRDRLDVDSKFVRRLANLQQQICGGQGSSPTSPLLGSGGLVGERRGEVEK
jgi:REP element-mobilizing transposase RayT